MNNKKIREIKNSSDLEFAQFGKYISKYYKAITKQIKESLEENLKAIEPFLKYINGIYRELPEKLKVIIKNLAYRGWYILIEMELPEITLLSGFITNKKYDELDNYMCNIIESKLDQIEKEIIQKYPNRKKIIHFAFCAHKKGEYDLSVPVFLIQADGICNELLKVHLYSKKNKRPLTEEKVEKYVSDSIIMSALVEPLRNISGLNVSTEYKNQYPIILNRHEIIHGLDLNYGN